MLVQNKMDLISNLRFLFLGICLLEVFLAAVEIINRSRKFCCRNIVVSYEEGLVNLLV